MKSVIDKETPLEQKTSEHSVIETDIGVDGVEKPRRIRSFVRRQGRLTEGQQRALDEHWPQYGLTLDCGMLNFT